MQTTIENEVNLSEREQFIADLRSAADFFEQHPDVPRPGDPYFAYYTSKDAEGVKEFARAFPGRVEKNYETSDFWARGKMGTITFVYGTPREKVCERVVTGTKVIPAHVIPAQPETEVPEKVEEVVEWRCHPLLEGGEK